MSSLAGGGAQLVVFGSTESAPAARRRRLPGQEASRLGIIQDSDTGRLHITQHANDWERNFVTTSAGATGSGVFNLPTIVAPSVWVGVAGREPPAGFFVENESQLNELLMSDDEDV